MEQNMPENKKGAKIKLDKNGEPIVFNFADKNNEKIKLNSESELVRRGSKKYLVKKVVMFILFLLILITAGYIYFLFSEEKDDNSVFLEQNAKILEKKEITEPEIDKNLDTDQDKLPDYLEKIIGTSESNPDTDGDGYDDLEEIKNGYSPLGDKKYTDEEWYNVKEKIRKEDERLFREMFGGDGANPNFVCGTDTVKDIDNNIYNTVQIGEQCWLKENLKVTKNPAGVAITRYCYDNDPAICETDGGLYDWNTAMNNSIEEGTQGICPDGWHVPKDLEWYVLESGLASDSCSDTRIDWGCDSSGAKLISNGSSGFDGIFVGGRDPNGSFGLRGDLVYFWSSTKAELNTWSFLRLLDSSHSSIRRSMNDNRNGFSVRCFKD